MIAHQQITQLIIAYTPTGAFVFTVIATLGSMIGWVKFADNKQQSKLFYVLIVEVVVLCLGFFSGFLKFDPRAVANRIAVQGQNKGELAQTIGLLHFSPIANDYIPSLRTNIQNSKEEMWFVGVSFYVSLPQYRDLLIEKARGGTKIKFLILDSASPKVDEIARSFSQTPEELRAECLTTVSNLKSIAEELMTDGAIQNFEVRLISERPGARYYIFDPRTDGGLMFFIPHAHGLDSPNVPGLLFGNVEGGLLPIFYQSAQHLWAESKPLH